MSSRNAYLSADEREQALCLSRGLKLAEELHAGGERRSEIYREAIKEFLASTGATPQYVHGAEAGHGRPD